MNFDKNNLIVLMYHNNNINPKVSALDDVEGLENFSVDVDKGVWFYVQIGPGLKNEFETPIGQSRRMLGSYAKGTRYGVIGVYDRTNVEHINSLAHGAIGATRIDD